MSLLKKIIGLFSGGAIKTVSDTVDKWRPSPVTRNAMDLENQQAGDQSQESARAMPLATHDTWFDVLVDGVNRLVRPVVTFWIIGGLAGFWTLPATGHIDPVMLNIGWTVIGFWFGSRALLKDLPAAVRALRK